jgi:S-DNA-T family DNA segregation ATPase FtsK/SpoIIIE
MLENGAEDDEIFERMSKEKPIFIFVSSFAAFLKTVYTAHEECGGMMNGFFENILEKGRLHNIYFVFDSNMEDITSMLGRRIYSIVTGYKSGVQLGGLAGQKVFDTSNVPFVEQGKTYRPGTGMAFNINGGEKIIIPSSKGV